MGGGFGLDLPVLLPLHCCGSSMAFVFFLLLSRPCCFVWIGGVVKDKRTTNFKQHFHLIRAAEVQTRSSLAFVTLVRDAVAFAYFQPAQLPPFCPFTAPLHTPPQLHHEFLMPMNALPHLAVALLGFSHCPQAHDVASKDTLAPASHHSTTSPRLLPKKSQPNDLLILSHARPDHFLRCHPGQLQPAAGCPGLCHARGPCDSFRRRHCWYVALRWGAGTCVRRNICM